MRALVTSLFLGLTVITLCISTAEASRRKREKPPKKKIEIVNRPISIVPYIKGGYLIGAVTEYVESQDRALWGGGLRVEHFISPKVRVDLGGEALFGKFADSDLAKMRAYSLAVGSCFMFTPQRQSGFYGRAELGRTSIKAVEMEIDPRSYTFIRLGLGRSIYSKPTVTTRIEIFYTVILSDDWDSYPYLEEVDFNLTYIGLQLGFLFGL